MCCIKSVLTTCNNAVLCSMINILTNQRTFRIIFIKRFAQNDIMLDRALHRTIFVNSFNKVHIK